MRIGRSSSINDAGKGREYRISGNQGFSLVELIIVVAIMAILAGGLALSLSVVSNRKVSKCADEIAATIERAKVLTLGKAQNDVECIISYDSTEGAYYAVIIQGGTEVSNRKVGESPITVTVYFDNDETTGYTLDKITGDSPAADASAGLHLLFNRSSGAFMEGTNKADGAEKKYCSGIIVSGSDRKVEINTVGRTGKITTVK